ncbi:MAG: nucleoside hydrolase, partial [Clostridia bacterium]|nr:nucleoside hydrolase [Clostridia bacterium]
ASWDLTAMLEAVRPGQYWDYHPHGRITVDDSGITTWHPAQDSRHTFLLPRTDAAELRAVMDGLVLGQ